MATKAMSSVFETSITREERLSRRQSGLALTISRRLGVNLPKLEPKIIEKELQQFVETGNFDANVKIACINPTFISPDEDREWMITKFVSCPFDAYFPVPFNDQPSPDLNFGNSAYRYCKLKLQSFASELKNRKDRICFFFYLNNCMEQCLTDKSMKNRFQVIHCPDVIDEFGLANVLLAATGCLADTPEAVLLTETRLHPTTRPSLAEYVEGSLCCPISLIPTVYGVRLASHVKLGGTECIEFHDCVSKHIQCPSTMRWLKVPAYSKYVRLDISPDLKSVIEKLFEYCHMKPAEVKQLRGRRMQSRDDEVEETELRQLTPLTFFFILQSLLSRLEWVDGAKESLAQLAIPPSFSLAWKTIQNWINGCTMLVLSTVDCLLPGDFNWNGLCCLCLVPKTQIHWWLVPKDSMIQHKAKLGKQFPEACREEAQRIDVLLSTNDKNRFLPKSKVDSNFFLLLTMNHELDRKNTRLCITVVETGMLIYYTDFFKWFRRSCTIVNCSPSTQPALPSEPENLADLQISTCLEFQDRYEVEVRARDRTNRNLSNGILCKLFINNF